MIEIANSRQIYERKSQRVSKKSVQVSKIETILY